ncbi:exosome complex component RRP43-like [Ruditapes philippinarum]|uniref:exosome complex component RRP43-like n=1 Tax=Ruditapes philippinarum TaxID=129788 RepID=UPI00295AEEBD|nr:exosome complex component RRP43-like [Ruditapes philippinarum]
MADDSKTARPLEYYRKFIEKDVRPDDRNLEEFRPTILNIGCVGTAEGSALVKLGNTTVMCGIKAEIAAPKTEQPKKGFIVPNVELGPLCSAMFRPGPPGDQAQDLSSFMNEVVKHSCCINTEDLCIVPGKYVWVLYCDLVCLNYDGYVTDACVLALLAAFKTTCLPTVTMDEDTDKLETDDNKKSPLSIQCLPVSSTFTIFDENILLVDPTIEEEALSTGEVTVVTTNDDQLCIIRKPGGSALSPQQLDLCIERAFLRSKQVVRLIHETMNSVDR